ncbi:MAG: alpha/beta fold hydrolase [Rhizobiaceae bacterium]
MKRALFTAAALLAGLTFAAQAAETVVTIGTDKGNVVGTLETPDAAGAPVILLLHGFTGTRDELPVNETDEGVFSRTARLLAEAGYASLRIDFRGSGDSDGKWEDTTFSGQIADAVAAIDWLKAHSDVDGSKLGIIGWSQGGLVASHAAAARAEDVDAVVLWAPAVFPLHNFEPLVGADTLAAALVAEPDEAFTFKLPWGVDTTLKASFFHELATTSTVGAVSDYDGPLKVIVGTKDTVVAPQPALGEVLMTYHDGEESLSVIDSDHVWNAFIGPQTIDGEMVPMSVEWFAAHLQ